MTIFKALTSISTVIVLSFTLAGCVSESYSYDGYRDYGPSYGGYYSGSGITYRNGPRYDSRYYRDRRDHRSDRWRNDSRRPGRDRNDGYARPAVQRPEPRPQQASRRDQRLIVVPQVNQGNSENSNGVRFIKRESHN